jgi:hypothetical protein
MTKLSGKHGERQAATARSSRAALLPLVRLLARKAAREWLAQEKNLGLSEPPAS